MGRIADEPGTALPLDGALPDGVLGEVRIHREIYRRRPEVGGICRIMPPAVMALSAAGTVPAPPPGIAAYFTSIPPWNDPLLLPDDAPAPVLAARLGAPPAPLIAGHRTVAASQRRPNAATPTRF